MAQGTTQRKEDLKRELKLTRELMDFQMEELSEELNYVAKFRNSVRQHPFLWSAGAFLSAFSLVKIFGGKSRKREIIVEKASGSSAMPTKKGRILTTALAFSLPFIKQWAAQALRDRFFPSDTHNIK